MPGESTQQMDNLLPTRRKSQDKMLTSQEPIIEKSPKVFYGFSDDGGKYNDYCKKFRQTAKSFYGFLDGDGEFEEYCRQFDRMKSSYLRPVVIIERLPVRILRGGKDNKKIHVYLKSGLKEGSSRVLEDEVATATSGIDDGISDRTATNGEQLLNGAKARKSPKSHSSADFVQNFLDEERRNCAQPRCSTTNVIQNGVIMGKDEYAQHDETKRSNKKCLTWAADIVSDHVSGDVIKTGNGSVQSRRPSLTGQIPLGVVEIEERCRTQRPSKFANSKLYRVDSPRKCQENSSTTECVEEVMAEEEERVQTSCSSKRKIQHDIADSPTKRPKCSDKSGIRVRSPLPIVDTSRNCKEGSKEESSCDKMELDDIIAEKSPSRDCSVPSDQAVASIESQIFNFYHSVCVNLERNSPVDKTESLTGTATADIDSTKTDQDIVEDADDLIEKQRENVLCPEKCEIQIDTKTASVFPLSEDMLIGCPSKSVATEAKDIGIDEDGNTQTSCEGEAFQRMWLMLQPCVVKLKPLPDDIVDCPGPSEKKAFHRAHRPSNSRHHVTEIEPPESNVKGLPELDLSDGFTLKRLCQLKSIELSDSDSDDESHDVVTESRGQLASVSVISDSEEDRASPKLTSTSPVQSHVLKDLVSSSIFPNDDHHDFNVSNSPQIDVVTVDSVVSENPVPSGVQALSELGFLDNESFQFGKDHPSEDIWSDVLDFVEPVVRDMPAPGDLLPLSSEQTEDLIPCLDSERPIEVDSLTDKVTVSTGFDKSYLETINIKPKIVENEEKCVEGYCKNTLDSFLSDKEYLMNDPLMTCEVTETSDLNNSSSRDANLGECEFLTSLIRPEKEPRNFSYRLNKDQIVKRKKYNSDDYLWYNDSPRDSAKRTMNKRKNHETASASRESGEDGKAREAYFQNPRRIPKKYKRREPNYQNHIDERGWELRASTNWWTQNVKADKGKNDGSVENDEKSNGIGAAAKETVPSSETLYRDLSTIPYLIKCNLQNRSRKCKDLHPCANANKNFKLYFTLTVGVGRRLSKPLIDTFQNPSSCVINRTTAYIAASAVSQRPTTILLSALPQVVQAILPVYHSNLLMELVAETEEMEKKEKRSNSDMAIAETLQFKRALMAMKARFPNGRKKTPPQFKPPQLKLCSATDQNPPQLILQSVQPGQSTPGYMYKSNQIVAVKSKTDNKFQFVRKCLVSILSKDGKKGVDKPKEGESGESSAIQVETNSEVKSGSSPQKGQKETSVGSNPSAVISANPKTDGIMGLKSRGKQWIPLYTSTSQSAHTAVQVISSQKSKETQRAFPVVMSVNKAKSCQAMNGLQAGRTDLGVKHSRPSSCTSGISSMDSEDSGNGSAENDNSLHQGKTSRKDHVVPVRSEVIPDDDSPEDHSNLQTEPDVIHISDEESIDLTGDETSIDLTERLPTWSVVCTSMPELGFVGVQKPQDKVLIYDKAIVAHPMEFDSVLELGKFLNSRLTHLPKHPQSKMDLKWILVDPGYLAHKKVPPTNSQFWLQHSNSQARTSKVIQRAKTSQSYTAMSGGRHISLLNTQTSRVRRGRLIPKYNVSEKTTRPTSQRKYFDRSGTVMRIINGQPVLISRPVSESASLPCDVAPASSSPIVSNPGLPVVKIALPASSASTLNKSVSTVPNRIVKTANVQGCVPQYIFVPGSMSPTGKPTRYVLASSQPAVCSSSASSAPGQATRYVLASSQPAVATTSASSAPGQASRFVLPSRQPAVATASASSAPGQASRFVLPSRQAAVATTSASSAPSQASRFVLLSSQPAVATTSASLAPSQPTKHVVASSPLPSTSASSTLRGPHPTSVTTAIRPPSVSTDSSGQTSSSPTIGVPGPAKAATTPGPTVRTLVPAASLKTPPVTSMTTIPIRAPFRQIVLTPGTVKCQTFLSAAADLGSKAQLTTPSTLQNVQQPFKFNHQLARNQTILIQRKNSADATEIPKKCIIQKPELSTTVISPK